MNGRCFITVKSKLFFRLAILATPFCFWLGISLGNAKEDSFIDLPYESFQTGDLIFRRGPSIESFGVCIASKSMLFSHVGMLVNSDSGLYVIHVVPKEKQKNDRVKYEPIESFTQKDAAQRVAVYRPKESEEKRLLAARYAFQSYEQECSFDRHYDMKTNQELYCTELVIKSLGKINADWLQIKPTSLHYLHQKKDVLMPIDLIHSQQLTEVYYAQNNRQ